MSLISGKQVRNGSLKIEKLDVSTGQGAVTFGTGSMLGAVDAPSNATDFANKAYVDASRSGLDFKDSVRVATTATITLSGTQTIDGVALSVGDRVLVKNQSSGAQNGIYVVAVGAWSRSTDADNSSPTSEVTSGMFCFAEEGNTQGGRGYVLNTANPIILGTTPLTFVQFTAQGAYVAGDGISISGQIVSVALQSNSGLVVNGSGLAVNSSIAGTGLTYASGVLSVNAIPLNDSARVTGTLSTTHGGTGSSIDPTSITDGMLLIGHAGNDRFQAASLTAGTAITISNAAAAITIGVTNNSIGVSQLNIGSPVTNRVIGWDGSGLVWVTNPDNQQLTGNNNNNGTYTFSLSGDSPSSITVNWATMLNQVSVGAHSDVTITSAQNGQVFRYSGTAWVNAFLAGADVTFNNSGTGLSATNVQAAIAELKSLLDAVDVGIMSLATADRGQVAVAAANDQFSGALISAKPLGYVLVYVNGLFQRVEGNKTAGDCYFTGDNGATARTLANIQAGDKLYWLGTNAGYSLDTNDVIDLIYET